MSCYRIRMKFGTDGDDFAKKVWDQQLVGMWFGSWDVNDLYEAYDAYNPQHHDRVTNVEIVTHINAQLLQRGLPQNMQADFVHSYKVFDELPEDTWIFTYFDDTLHFGQIANINPRNEPAFDCQQEHFKAKPIKNSKSFKVAELPDAFRALVSAGQGTLHKVPSYEKLTAILIKAADSDGVVELVSALSLEDWMDALGPKGWESVCTAYLILEHGFVPSGLLIGKTLADFDIVGHNLAGIAIYGQCKKNPVAYKNLDAHRRTFERLPEGALKFFFPYAGPDEWPGAGVTVISYKSLRAWCETTENGKRYEKVLRHGS